MSKQCKCGKGYVSVWDNKCGKCRTKKEQNDHQFALMHMDLTINNSGMSPADAYNYNRKLCK